MNAPLSDSDLDKWIETEHTKIKHVILIKYMDAWIKIVGSREEIICYWDCFAGRGELVDEQHNCCAMGSPLLILELAKKYSSTRKIICIFIEKDEKNYEHLKTCLIKSYGESIKDGKYDSWNINNIAIHAKKGIFEEKAKNMLEMEPGKTLRPSFFFIDPFGFGGYPFEIIKKMLSFKKTEIFFTFMVRDMIRFLDSSNHKNCLNSIFGNDDWRNIIKNSNDKENALKDLFKDKLEKEGGAKYVQDYRISMDTEKRTLFYLIHVSNDPKGLRVMTDVMHNESEGRFEFRGPDNKQLNLGDFIDNEERIQKEIVDILNSGENDLKKIVEKLYTKRIVYKNTWPILDKLVKNRKINVLRKPEKTSTGKDVKSWDYEKYKIKIFLI